MVALSKAVGAGHTLVDIVSRAVVLATLDVGSTHAIRFLACYITVVVACVQTCRTASVTSVASVAITPLVSMVVGSAFVTTSLGHTCVVLASVPTRARRGLRLSSSIPAVDTLITIVTGAVVLSTFAAVGTFAIAQVVLDVTTVVTSVGVAGTVRSRTRYRRSRPIIAEVPVRSAILIGRVVGTAAVAGAVVLSVVDHLTAHRALAVHIAADLLTSVGTSAVVGDIPVVGCVTTSAVVLGVVVAVVTGRCFSARTLTEGAASTDVAAVVTSRLCCHCRVVALHTVVAITEVLTVVVGVTFVGTTVDDASSTAFANVARGATLEHGATVAIARRLTLVPAGTGAEVVVSFGSIRAFTKRACSADVATIITIVGVAGTRRTRGGHAIDVAIVAVHPVGSAVAVGVMVGCRSTGRVGAILLAVVECYVVGCLTLAIDIASNLLATVRTAAITLVVTVGRSASSPTVVLVVVVTVVTRASFSTRTLTHRLVAGHKAAIVTGRAVGHSVGTPVTGVTVTPLLTVLVCFAFVHALVAHTLVVLTDVPAIAGSEGVTTLSILAGLAQSSVQARAVIGTTFDWTRALAIGVETADVTTVVTVVGVAGSC